MAEQDATPNSPVGVVLGSEDAGPLGARLRPDVAAPTRPAGRHLVSG